MLVTVRIGTAIDGGAPARPGSPTHRAPYEVFAAAWNVHPRRADELLAAQ